MLARVSFFIAWYDGWIGYFFDRKSSCLYLAPLPWCVVKIDFSRGGA